MLDLKMLKARSLASLQAFDLVQIRVQWWFWTIAEIITYEVMHPIEWYFPSSERTISILELHN